VAHLERSAKNETRFPRIEQLGICRTCPRIGCNDDAYLFESSRVRGRRFGSGPFLDGDRDYPHRLRLRCRAFNPEEKSALEKRPIHLVRYGLSGIWVCLVFSAGSPMKPEPNQSLQPTGLLARG
jgi:hypothetical protein